MNREEEEHCKAFITWCNLQCGTIPELRLIYHVPNGGARPTITKKDGTRVSIEGAKLKAMGLRAGVLDYHLPVARTHNDRLFIGLWLEFKSKTGRVEPEQQEWSDAMRRHGHRVETVRDWEKGKQIVLEYLGIEDMRPFGRRS